MANRLARHEAFQRIIARGAIRRNAAVISTSTTAAADLIILLPLSKLYEPGTYEPRAPLIVEVKTLSRGYGRTGTLKPLQEALRARCGTPGDLDAIFVHVTRSKGPEGLRDEIHTTPPSEWATTFIRECIREGENAKEAGL